MQLDLLIENQCKHQDIKQKEAPQKFASESEWFTSDSPN